MQQWAEFTLYYIIGPVIALVNHDVCRLGKMSTVCLAPKNEAQWTAENPKKRQASFSSTVL